jgi:hypothetical protein
MDRRDEIWRDSALTIRLESPAAAAMATPKLHAADFVSEERPRNGYLALSLSRQALGRPDARRASASIALSGPQTYSSSVQGGLLLAEAATEPNTYRRNLCSRGSHELGPIGLNMQARVSPRPLLGILVVAERTGLIAKQAPPRLPRPSAW